MDSGSLYSIALTLFLVANPIGNSPAILALIKDFPFERQKRIMFRESLIALAIALFFQFVGERFLGLLSIKDYSLSLTGGILLFLVSLEMIFPQPVDTQSATVSKQEPFIVPIATPLISGAGLMTMIMIFSKKQDNDLQISLAICLAWVGVTLVLVTAPYLQKILGRRGLVALEQIMGMILALISSEMIVNGIRLFVNAIKA